MLALLAACAVIPGAAVHFFGETEVAVPGTVHFLAIGLSAGLAALAAVALTVGVRGAAMRAPSSSGPPSPRWPRCSRSTA
jgi:hypothetical protein